MPVVIDANLAIKAVVPTKQNDAIDTKFDEWASSGLELIAPRHFNSEVVNTIRRKVYQGELRQAEGRDALALFLDIPVRIVITRLLLSSAWDLAVTLNLPGTYDAEYMVLAQFVGCEFWTADARFISSLGSSKPDWVRFVR